MLEETPPASLRQRLQTLWDKGPESRVRFYAMVDAELRPRLARMLSTEFKFHDHDIDESISQALEGLLDRSPVAKPIDNAQAYIWESAKNAARDIIGEREEAAAVVIEQTRMLNAEKGRRGQGAEDAATDPPAHYEEQLHDQTSFGPELSALVLDSVLEGVEASPSWAIKVVELALERLPPRQRDAIKIVLLHGPEFNAEEAAEILDIKDASTYRATKHRAYKSLERLVPEVMRELGVPTTTIGIPDIFEQPHEVGDDLGDSDTSTDSSET